MDSRFNGVMATLVELCPQLSVPQSSHLQRLMRTWAPLADISFADLLLCVPDRAGYTVVGHMRPSTSRSIYRTEMVGERFEPGARPFMDLARSTGQIIDGGMIFQAAAPHIRTLSVPVRCGDDIIAVLSREFAPDEQRDPGELEMNYFFTFRRLAQMISEGSYPFAAVDAEGEESPRVSDGLLVVDASARVRFASPNAASVLSRLGVRRVEGQRLSAAGVDGQAVRLSFADQLPHVEEATNGDITVVVHCVPLLEAGELTGAVVFLRDITELRRRDRLLLSKDAMIAEIHHRVKNNLQTISSLLRLQGRRVVEDEARQAIEVSVRRIRAIAVVHEILSQQVESDVAFDEIVRPLVRLVEEGFSTPERPLRFSVTGDAGNLPTEITTPLAVVLSELLQNAVQHAFPGTDRAGATVEISFDHESDSLRLVVVDNGVGLRPDFDIEASAGLGLTIVRSLVENDLNGQMSVAPVEGEGTGTTVVVNVPLARAV